MSSSGGRGFGRARRSTIRGRRSLSHDPDVVAWVRERTRAGWNRDQIVQASREDTHGWPRSGDHLTNGGVSEVRAAIAALEHDDAPAPKRPPRESGSRLRQIHAERRDSGPSDVLDMRERVMKAVGALEWIEMPDIGLSEIETDAISMVYDDLVILSRWTDAALSAVIANMDDLQRQRKIQMLRDRAVDPSSTPNERESAARLAVVLEEKRNAARLGEGA